MRDSGLDISYALRADAIAEKSFISKVPIGFKVEPMKN
jgi:ketol-acid reductoisomerase